MSSRLLFLIPLILAACAHQAAPLALKASSHPIHAETRQELVRLVSNELARAHGAFAVEVGVIQRRDGKARCKCSYLVQAGAARLCGFAAIATVDLARGTVELSDQAIQWCEGDADQLAG